MNLKFLNEDEYIAELNRQLRQHPEYEDSLMFMAYPPGATGSEITGVAHSGFWRKVYMEVQNAMSQEYDVRVSPRSRT